MVFDVLTFLLHFFLFLPNLSLVIAFSFGFLVFCKRGLAIKAPDKHCKEKLSSSLIKFLGGNLSAVPASFYFPLFLIFLSISSTFSAAKHPSEDDNSEDGWLNPPHP